MGPGNRRGRPRPPPESPQSCLRTGQRVRGWVHVVTGLPHQEDAGKNDICLWLPKRSVIQLNKKYRVSLGCPSHAGSGAEPWKVPSQGETLRLLREGLERRAGFCSGSKTIQLPSGFSLRPLHTLLVPDGESWEGGTSPVCCQLWSPEATLGAGEGRRSSVSASSLLRLRENSRPCGAQCENGSRRAWDEAPSRLPAAEGSVLSDGNSQSRREFQCRWETRDEGVKFAICVLEPAASVWASSMAIHSS